MRRTMSLCVLAGAAFGVSNMAVAESPAWSSSNDADEIRALVAEMLADADSRSSLLQGGTAGHDGKFFLASADGNFRMNIGGQLQARYVFNFRDEDSNITDPDTGDTIEDDDFESGAEIRRAKIAFSGHAFDPSIIYKIQGAFDRNGGSFDLEDAYVGFKMDNGGTLHFGQFKAPLLREELVSSSRQLAAERSVTNEFFSANRSQGGWYRWENDSFRWDLSINDGGTNSTFMTAASNTGFNNDTSDFAVTTRVEWLASGEWSQFKDFTSPQGSADGMMIGGAFHYQMGKDLPTGDGPDVFFYTVDMSYESDGWGAFIAGIGSNVDPDTGSSRDDYGVVGQAQVYLSEDWELFGRVDYIFVDDEGVTSGNDTYGTLTFGVNYYMHGHGAKFTADVNVAIEEATVFQDPDRRIRNTGLGQLGDDDDGEVYVRLQYQLLF